MADESVHKPLLLISAGTLTSRVLGLVRDLVLAAVWGTGAAMGGWVFAFTVPNLLRALFAEGAFSSAFVPVFSERLATDGEQGAWRSATVVITTLLLVVAVVSAAIVLFSLPLRFVISEGTGRVALELLPLAMPYAVLIAGSTAFAAVLNSTGRFAVPAFSPLLLNVFLIAAALGAAQWLGGGSGPWIVVLPVAALAAGVVQLLLHALRCAHVGFPWRFRLERNHADTRRIATLMAPVMLGVGVMQLNILVDRTLAAWLGSEAITSLYYSQRLVYLPVGLFGVALGVASLPLLSRAWACGRTDEMAGHLRTGLGQVLFLSVPAAAALFVVRTPLVSLLFERGAFDASDTSSTVWALLFYLPGIPAFAAAKVATTPFHAAQDTKTPVQISAVCLGLNIVLNLSLMPFLRQGGLALATSIASWLNVLLLLRSSQGRLPSAALAGLGTHGLRILVSAALGIAVGLAATAGLRRLAEAPNAFAGRLLFTLVPLAAFALVYLAVSRLLGVRDGADLLRALRGRRKER